MKYPSILFLAFFLLGASNTPIPSVPIGGVLGVFSNLPGTWQPPVSGAIKDGFMRADGAQVPASCTKCKIPAGTVLPDLTDRVLRGSTTSGTNAGSDSVTLSVSQIPQMSGTGTTSTPNKDFGTGTFSTNETLTGGHYHLMFANSYGGTSDDLTSSTWVALGSHGRDTSLDPYAYYMRKATSASPSLGKTGDTSNHTHSVTIDKSNFDHTHPNSSVAISVGSASPSAVPTLPSNTTTIFVIRVM